MNSSKTNCLCPNLLVQADALTLLERLEDNFVTLCYLDPPWFAEFADPDGDDPELEQKRLTSYLSQIVCQVHRVLNAEGSVFYHSTPRLSGTIRPILDQVFGEDGFRTEFIWSACGQGPRNDARVNLHDHIYLYSKTDSHKYNAARAEYSGDELRTRFPLTDERGRYRREDLTTCNSLRLSNQFGWREVSLPPSRSWKFNQQKLESLDQAGEIHWSNNGRPSLKRYVSNENRFYPIESVWSDIQPVCRTSSTGQKPVELLQRIVEISTDEGDVVLDPMCGSGSALFAAASLDRQWIGGDRSDSVSTVLRNSLIEDPSVGGFEFDLPKGLAEYPRISKSKTFVFTLPGEKFATFVLNGELDIEETRHYEFKEVNGVNPVRTIKSAAYEYAVAFLNSEGGKIYWGVRDDRTVCGVKMGFKERDQLRRSVSQEFRKIQPAVDPSQFRIEIHPVIGTDDKELVVVEVTIPKPTKIGPYFTSSGKCYVKIDGERKELNGPELAEWVRRRLV